MGNRSVCRGLTQNDSPLVRISRNDINGLDRFWDEVTVERDFRVFRHCPLKDGTVRDEEVWGG
jgi:hypothetical protein